MTCPDPNCRACFVAPVETDGDFGYFEELARRVGLPIVRREAHIGTVERPIYGCPGCGESIGSLGTISPDMN